MDGKSTLIIGQFTKLNALDLIGTHKTKSDQKL